MTAAYDNLKQRFADIKNLGNATGILAKDMETAMPPGAANDRAQQQMAIGAAIHHLIADPKVEEWLDEAEAGNDNLPPPDRRNLALMRHSWVHSASLPPDLSRELARLDSEGWQRHAQNYRSGDWSKMKDWYAHSFKIMREAGAIKKEKLGVPSAYDALLDQFSPGLREEIVAREFSVLASELPGLIQKATAKQKNEPDPLPLQGPFRFAQQDQLCNDLARAAGFDFSRGKFYLLADHHPSSGGSSDDNRITARYNENDFLQVVHTVLHEAGHGIYEQNLPLPWRYQPAGSHLGMALHESQSMIMELQAGMSRAFIGWLEARARAVFGRPDDPALAADNLLALMTRVAPSYIRIHSDELTYPAHIVLRWRLEKDMISGALDPSDLPDAWAATLKELLGIAPPDNAQGCMQDVHWPSGAIGYFPAYTLGAMGAAQFFATARKARPELPQALSEGNFAPLREWLRDNVHGKGSLQTYDELFTAATGGPLNARYYLDHLTRRYLEQEA